MSRRIEDLRRAGRLRLTPTGPGSRASIEDYVRRVITQRTVPNYGTSAERLARVIVTSVLHRLGAGYGASVGEPPLAPTRQPR